jgi:hypothetical protein
MYILKEIYMNCSFTMDTIITGVEANTFNDAKNIVENTLIDKDINFEIVEDNSIIYRYSLSNNITGIMDNKQLKVLKLPI